MHVVITGSRHWTNEAQLREHLDSLLEKYPDLEIHHGKSKGGGVDLFAEQWAHDNDVPAWPYPVRKDLDGNHRGAPLNRNIRMLKTALPALTTAFRSSGKSNGTDHCVEHSHKLGIEVEIVEENNA